MPRKNTQKKSKKQKKDVVKKQNQKVKGKKNNANQNNINIKITGDKGGKTPPVSSGGGGSFSYPVYSQSPLMQQVAPSQPAFGSAAPVATNPLANPVSVTEPVRNYNRDHYPNIPVTLAMENGYGGSSIISDLTDYTNGVSKMRRYNNNLSNPYDEIGQTLAPYSIDTQNDSNAYGNDSNSYDSRLYNKFSDYSNDSNPSESELSNSQQSDIGSNLSNPYENTGSTLSSVSGASDEKYALNDQVNELDKYVESGGVIPKEELAVKPFVAKYVPPNKRQPVAEQLISNEEEDLANQPIYKDFSSSNYYLLEFTAGEDTLRDDLIYKTDKQILSSRDYGKNTLKTYLEKVHPSSGSELNDKITKKKLLTLIRESEDKIYK